MNALARAALTTIATILAAVLAMTTLTACSDESSGGPCAGTYRFETASKPGRVFAAGDRERACAFTGTFLDGTHYRLGQDTGKVIVVNFWASWCAPCKVETPQFDLLHRELMDRDITFVGVDYRDVKDKAREFVDTHDISFPSLFDPLGELPIKLGNIATPGPPFTVLIDKKQRVAAVYLGIQSPKDLEPALDTLAAE